MEPLLVALVLALGVGLFYLGAILHRQYTYWRKRGVPFVEVFPLIGNNGAVLLRFKTFPAFIEDAYYRYPGARYHGLFDFNSPVVMLRDPELIKDVCVKKFDHFPDHRTFVDEEMDPIFGRNVFSLRGDRWRDTRNALTPSFTATRMKFLFQLVSRCAEGFAQYLADHPVDEVEAKDAFTRYTNDVIATAAFGVEVDSMKNRTNDFYESGRDTANFGSIPRVIKFLIFRVWPRLLGYLGVSFLSAKSTRFFKDLVADTVEQRQRKGIVRPDMIQLLMQARDKEGGPEMSIDDMTAQAFIFFVAGFDTTSTLLCFMARELSLNPDIQEKLRQEVDQLVESVDGDEEGVTYQTLGKLKYMDMVISETLRKYPPAPFFDRLCLKPYDLPASMPGHRPITVDPGTVIWVPIYALHNDPRYFPEPQKFHPERFSEENKDNIQPYTYMPFGVGPRKCLGTRFALMETKILFLHLLRRFVIKPTPKTRREVVFSKASFNMMIEGGFWVKFEPRKI
ncbi:cytochrome P450 9e2 [Orussus abietinus]|uniref:cytochrome P450 9e2 n=1 Tax=Orussus abietinus TaxID=222816 RepID=UPI000625A570|nr:cytochrome P450 9e2 [Orussus abietinus]